jgi:hypothetical protein
MQLSILRRAVAPVQADVKHPRAILAGSNVLQEHLLCFANP